MRKRCDYRNCISDSQTLLTEGSKELWNKMPGRGCAHQLVAMCVGTLHKGMKRAWYWLMQDFLFLKAHGLEMQRKTSFFLLLFC